MGILGAGGRLPMYKEVCVPHLECWNVHELASAHVGQNCELCL